MFLSGSSIFESKEFLQIVLLVGLAIMSIAGIVATYFHYRKKRGDNEEVIQDTVTGYAISLASAGPINFQRDVNALFIDGQILKANGEKHAALQNEVKVMNEHHASLAGLVEENHDEEKTNELRRQMKKMEMDIARVQRGLDLMKTHLINEEELLQAQKKIFEKDQEIQRIQHLSEQQNKEIYLQEQQKQSFSAELSKMEHQLNEMRESAKLVNTNFRETDASYHDKITEMDRLHYEEKMKWEDHLKNANEEYKKLEEENLTLQEQLLLAQTTVTSHEEDNSRVVELKTALKNAEDQVQDLKNKLSDLGYLGDLVKEKKIQVDFLQNQLEQRVKSNHELEHKVNETTEQLKIIQEDLSQHKILTASLQQELQTERQEIVRLQSDLQTQTHENQRRQESLEAKVRHISYQDEKMNELIQYNNNLQTAIKEGNNQMDRLETKLLESRQQIKDLEASLETKQQLLSKIYRDLGSLVGHEEKSMLMQPGQLERIPEVVG